jgi:succinylglutamate desuccinylase
MKPDIPIADNRIIADYGPSGGPLLLVTCLIHGNEPAGEAAARSVLETLAPGPESHLSGRIVVLRGNLSAIAAQKRYIDADLNRVFPTQASPAIPSTGRISELEERDELVALIKCLADEHPVGQRYFADLHTTSSQTIPYLSLPGLDEHTIGFGRKFPLHLVTSFYQYAPGSIDRFLHEQGFTGFTCEGGQHLRSTSATNMTALLWMMLEETGCLAPGAGIIDQSSLDEAHAILDEYVIGPPKIFEVTHRHALDGSEEFVMKPGFANFHQVERDEVIAKDKNGPVSAPANGNLLMPLYQPSGRDGFFMVQERSAPFENE